MGEINFYIKVGVMVGDSVRNTIISKESLAGGKNAHTFDRASDKNLYQKQANKQTNKQTNNCCHYPRFITFYSYFGPC